MSIRIKRVYASSSADDGRRVLVDRLWPRGLSKQRAELDEWCRDVAPSPELRRWFGHKPERWEAFRTAYRDELAAMDAATLCPLVEVARDDRLTLLYAARNEQHNHARVLAEFLEARQ
ncbi:DUF488 domain-containing protein [Spectribacter hydrogenoxidans]|uniref:DUF488 domain-containing protein n=1 Tax=Spectribacter hydrogenoxidans TaxID=3075608 RepID=A0ABU3BYB9_9GAMM|nr:DUF488 domain-containing protein [Salinisphaera sp. W335]MDT0634304.1 DUF488 domain-containing protein [Salinisphaera sp. W335]